MKFLTEQKKGFKRMNRDVEYLINLYFLLIAVKVNSPQPWCE